MRRLSHLLLLALLAACGGSDVDPPCSGSCAGATPLCESGLCVAFCAPGSVACDGTCVPTRTDPENCGGCGHACPDGVACENGACAGECAGQWCDDQCVDTDHDPAHCGDCGTDCGRGGLCEDGQCLCADTATDCGSYCADTQNDDDNCGGCGVDCDATEMCVAADCACQPGFDDCGDCVDVDVDPRHCGGCGEACDADQMCRDEECECRPGLVEADGDGCRDPASDPEDCGPLETECDGETPYCQEGACVAGCSDGHDACGFSCVVTRSNPLHCGGCGEACAVDEVCVEGDCRAYEPAIGCTSCPCEACDDEDACCAYGGGAICVNDDECP